MSGPHFRDYHLMLDDQGDELFAMIDVLAETLWDAQRAGRAPDEQVYLERLRRL